jgi:hypothetical protein
VATLIAIFAVIIATWQVIEARRASNKELALVRNQLGLAQGQLRLAQGQLRLAQSEYSSLSRPIVVPVPFRVGRPILIRPRGRPSFLRFKVQNATNAPAVSGFAYAFPDQEGTATCSSVEPPEGRNIPVPGRMPPIHGGQTVTLVVARATSVADRSVLCGGVHYTDAAGTWWATEWTWFPRERAPYGWIPFGIRSCQIEPVPSPIPNAPGFPTFPGHPGFTGCPTAN